MNVRKGWRIAVPAVVVGLAVTGGMVAAGAGTPPGVVDRQHPPPLPAIVNPDGTLNTKVVDSIPVVQPDGTLRLPTAAEVTPAALTPAQVVALTPAQRTAHHVQMAP